MTSRITRVPVPFEALENRMMLSAAPAVHHPVHAALHRTAAAAIKAAAAPATAALTAPASGGDPIYMNFNGIPGDVTANGHTGEIQLQSFQWGVGRGIGSPTGSSADRESSAPSVSEIVVTKTTDRATPMLLQAILTGTPEDVKIDFVTSSRGKLSTYLEYDLSNVLISSYSVSSGGDRPMESLSLNFTKIQVKYMVANADGSVTPISTGWDLSLGEILQPNPTTP
ncbi:MAG: type VI secretion system tube protein Hcp [Tepidisphaerales bacterium]